ncbi:hypothetical protein SAMD00019534_016790 [Acytostelium subglobosum LB1]|uniref:hypothetical protein n=1 Tax=Acytostelium subglobosum LB1 TaxID=1410327 RepID=UPI000644D3D2|nr:hypothetical protein SAMD00019534_016790 [Acytostelium subglobosum LB1]GAM18504.1 hypothetical protein SAMD00019534_016790 [Acytostelium subglobosum LB1]|eukprot:XP_012757724.1 hypothetical protein SAMD00019534_016790 [Acytostelium subglobosum LB1]
MSTTKNDLRAMMNKARAASSDKSAAASQKITSPYAKYNTSGKLSCILCSMNINNESMWMAHCNSKKHKDALQQHLQPNTQQPHQTTNNQVKRSIEETSSTQAPSKKTKTDTTTTSSQTSSSNNKKVEKDEVDETNNIPKGLPSDFFSSYESDGEDHGKQDGDGDKQDEEVAQQNDQVTSKLPQGFFDDPNEAIAAANHEDSVQREEELSAGMKEYDEAIKEVQLNVNDNSTLLQLQQQIEDNKDDNDNDANKEESLNEDELWNQLEDLEQKDVSSKMLEIRRLKSKIQKIAATKPNNKAVVGTTTTTTTTTKQTATVVASNYESDDDDEEDEGDEDIDSLFQWGSKR